MSRLTHTEQIDISPETIQKLQVNKKMYNTPDAKYTILNCDKNYLCDTDRQRRVYNSVIIDDTTQCIVNVGMPISMPMGTFEEGTLQVTELIEGTMIYLFYETTNERWQIATTNAVGGMYSYFRDNVNKSPTFSSMVMDAFREPTETDINKLPFLEYFQKEYCYGFVLQHPKNAIVHQIEHPKMWLVSVCHLHATNTNEVSYIARSSYETWDCFTGLKDSLVYFPKEFTVAKKPMADYLVDHCNDQTPKTLMGLNFVNTDTRDRCEVINPNYKEAKDIRGNNFNLQFHYLCLLKLGQVLVFLKHFPHYRQLFFNYKDQLEGFITKLHQTYFHYYISKKIKGPIHKKYYYHISEIHKKIFIPSLEEGKKKVIKRSVVSEYVKAMEPGQILHMLNFERHNLTETGSEQITL
jgi:hypothetical protein